VKKIALIFSVALATTLVAVVRGVGPDPAQSASHREAPLISLYPGADITDFFMFRSYEPGHAGKAVFIMNVNPASEPSAGPNYWNFDPSVVYSINVDNDANGKANDVRFEFRFRNEVRGFTDALDLPLSYLGGKTLPPIATLNDPGIGLRQRYEVTMVLGGGVKSQTVASGLIAVPSNVGPRTMPNYETLAEQGVYALDNGIRVFAGQRQDPFYIDLGGIFDTLNLRRDPPVLTPAEDEADNVNAFGTDMLSGFNVSTIALEVPIALLTADKKGPDITAHPRIGAYAGTTRPIISIDRVPHKRKFGEVRGRRAQIQRLANPLVNELIIATEDKDRWGVLDPKQEELFVEYYRNPRLALALELLTGVPAATNGREDLVNLLLRYNPADDDLSELLRLNVATLPTPLAAQRRMGPLASTPDPAAWPNGRRPRDDVVDIAIRVVGGPNYIAARAGDGVNVDDAVLMSAFPFLATPADGRNRQHENPTS
jgi:hypothetical protein